MKKRFLAAFVLVFMLINAFTFSLFAQKTSVSNTTQNDSLVFSINEVKKFRKNGLDIIDYTEHLDTLKRAGSFTIMCQFIQTGNVASSLLGISNSSMPAHHFHVYADSERIGYEFRMGNDYNLSVSSYTLNSHGINTIAFCAVESVNIREFFVCFLIEAFHVYEIAVEK